jgi:CRP/FNR family transcriptional regulator
LWGGLSPEEHEQVARLCPQRRFSKGSTIFAPGDAPDSLYVLLSGLVTLTHLSEGGQESILRVFGPGDVFGELFLTVAARPFLATALTACVVTVIPGKTFLHLLSTTPRIGFNFICVLSRHLAEMALDRGLSGHKWSLQRLALTLLKLGAAHGVEERTGKAIALPLTHQILADMIGTSRETVTRHLRRLKRQGAVSQRGRTLVIKMARLNALAPDWPASLER